MQLRFTGGQGMSKIVTYCRVIADDAALTSLYRSMEINYPKFFKMDRMSKAGFLAAEVAFRQAGIQPDQPKKDFSVVLVNSTSSTVDDIEFQKTIDGGAFFPSPSLFVYTLSNVVCGEIAIRNNILGETSFYVQKEFDSSFLTKAVQWAFSDSSINYVLCGWAECLSGDRTCHMMIVARDGNDGIDFTSDSINVIITTTNKR